MGPITFPPLSLIDGNLSRLPPILGYSVQDDLIPKWDFLSQVCQYGQFEVIRFPAYFSYPLERTRSRYEYLQDIKGVPVKLLSLDDVVRFGDEDFARTVAGDIDRGKAFAAYAKARSKEEKKRLSTGRRRGGGQNAIRSDQRERRGQQRRPQQQRRPDEGGVIEGECGSLPTSPGELLESRRKGGDR